MTEYTSLDEVTHIQRSVMLFIECWVREKKTIVPKKAIVDQMKQDGIAGSSTMRALESLLRRNYIRRADIYSNKTFYVQIRKL